MKKQQTEQNAAFQVAFLGAPGSYSDMACREVYPGKGTLSCTSFEDVFAAVEDGSAALALIPVDNTLAGRVADVHHLLPDSGLHIIGEHFQDVRHALLATAAADMDDIAHVHSHIHALPQCRSLLRRLGAQTHVHSDTARAAEYVAGRGDKTHAAIASLLSAELYGLKVLMPDIHDAAQNTTRFLILSRTPQVPAYDPAQPVLTSFVFAVRNIPAALYKALGGFATNGISLSKLESYVGADFQVARFYADIEAHPDSEACRLAFEELGFFADRIRVMGTYPVHPFRARAVSDGASE